MTATVAILDDDPAIRATLTEALEQAGLSVTAHSRADAFEAAVRRAMPDVCLVDLGLPDRDGLAVVSRLALEGGAAIIIISGRGQVQDRITGLELGADDYVVKPFAPAEIVARVRARLRKVAPQARRRAHFADWTADFDRFTLTGPGGEATFSQAEGEVLRLFLDRPRRLITRDEMQDVLGGGAREAFDRAMDVRISRLRAKLGEDPKNPALIKTIYGAGYIFLGDVSWS
ncbi:response regulator transcription factor [Jannaschia seohaensis]|uniref:DNA-binding response OmpR family regulator n=1 Tax=Jannaschia seohaensis TaxID=475081 RepID=A0A2Y9B281_9RHOB|nr:response regulator transcription factor [Jannaschia seohaensis]PWJ13308.1 DNA-binding response OmpR family regulator [Jannaschia seohaensis]SSA50634.1 DNA-binding response regulator, OmpR family, contains REC and winged-helix (wHTH) domain [Jannaschia seohaensis]